MGEQEHYSEIIYNWQGLTQSNSEAGDRNKGVKLDSKPGVVRSREPPDRDSSSGVAPPVKRPRPAVIPPSPLQQQTVATNNRHSSSSSYKQDHEEDEIQEVTPVKSEPREAVPSLTAVASVEAPYEEAGGSHQGVGGGGGQVALEDEYQDDSYDYGEYGEGYDDSSGMIGKENNRRGI
jgi:hypothetical protein